MADQASAPHPVPDDVTLCITSCARPDLLEQTLASFRRFHTIGAMIVSEDSGDERMRDWLKKNCPEAQVIFGPQKTGMMASIDRLYAAVITPFIFIWKTIGSLTAPSILRRPNACWQRMQQSPLSAFACFPS